MGPVSTPHAPSVPGAVGHVERVPAAEARTERWTEAVLRAARSAAIGEQQANLTSALGAVLCVVAGVALATGLPLLLAASLFAVGALCDLADGAIARAATDRRSAATGKFIDSFADKVGEIGVSLGLMVAIREDPVLFSLAALAFGLGMLTSFVKAFAESARFDLDWSEARLSGRAGRAVILAGTLVLAALLAEQVETVLAVGLAVLLVFNFATLIRRVLRVMAGDLPQSLNC